MATRSRRYAAHRSRSLLLSLCICAAGCGGGAAHELSSDVPAADTCQTTDVSAGPGDRCDAGAALGDGGERRRAAFVAGPSFADAGVHDVGPNGKSGAIHVDVPAGRRFVALRVAPTQAASGNVCYRVDDVVADGVHVWVPPAPPGNDAGVCTSCTQRVQSGHGYGFFVFPNHGGDLALQGKLRFRVVARHCRFGYGLNAKTEPDIPHAVAVSFAHEPAAPVTATPKLQLRFAVAPGTIVAAGAGDRAGALQTIIERVKSALKTAGVDVHVAAVVPLPKLEVSPEAAVAVGPGVRTAADTLYTTALAALTETPAEQQSRFIPVVVVPCLSYVDAAAQPGPVDGYTTRIPGGAPVGTHASMVLVAAGACGGEGAAPPLPAQVGTVLAHEIGHFLGLYHSDTPLGLHRAATQTDLMATNAVLHGDALGFTPAQAEVVRRHPYVYFQPDS